MSLCRWMLGSSAPGLILGTVLLLLSPAAAAAQQPASAAPETEPRRVGLVLDGGGALGIAHVGVLRWLVEHRIPVDCVAGTSMGALVGSTLATGLTRSEIDELVHRFPWDKVARDETPYDALSLRRKEDRAHNATSLQFGLRPGLAFPGGFNSGQQASLALDRLALPYDGLASFDDLPIPFRCVATDLAAGRSHVFDHGPLGEALRSTMAIPALFPPVRQDGRVFVDGSMLDNLPVDAVRRMGARTVVAVHLEPRPFDPNQPVTLIEVVSRSIDIVIEANERASLKQADRELDVDTRKFDPLGFESIEAIMDSGYQAAARQAAVLTSLALDEASWGRYEARRQARRRAVPVPRYVEVTGTRADIARALESDLADVVGRPLDVPALERRLTRVTGTGRFMRAGYRMTHHDDQTSGLQVHVEEKEYGPVLVDPLLRVAGSADRGASLALGARITVFDPGRAGAEWRNDWIAGSEYEVASELLWPTAPGGRWFLAPRAGAASRLRDVYFDGSVVAQYRERAASVGLDVGRALGHDAELRAGYEVGRRGFEPRVGYTLFPFTSGPTRMFRLAGAFETLDDPALPSKGIRARSGFQWHDRDPGAREGFPLGEARLEFFHPIGASRSAFLLSSAGTTFRHEVTDPPPFSLGGPMHLSAYGPEELLGDRYALVQTGIMRRLGRLPPLAGRDFYAIVSLEMGGVWSGWNGSGVPGGDSSVGSWHGAVTLALAAQTVLGPLSLGGSLGDRDHHQLFFQLGRFF